MAGRRESRGCGEKDERRIAVSKRLPQNFNDLLIDAIFKTDIEERELVAYEVELGLSQLWPRMLGRGLNPLALFVVSLVDAESYLVMRGEVLLHGSLKECARFVKSYRPEFFNEIY